MKRIKLLIIMAILTQFSIVQASVRIENIIFDNAQKDNSKITIILGSELQSTPNLEIKEVKSNLNQTIVQLEIPNSIVWPKITKKVKFNGSSDDSTLMAYQFNQNLVRIRAILPYSLSKSLQDKVRFSDESNRIVLYIPNPIKTISSTKPILKTKTLKFNMPKKQKSKNNYDEQFLEQLLSDKENSNLKSDEKTSKDKVSLKQASPQKVESNLGTFSVTKYIGKFVAFLGAILLLFYGIVHLLKKGVIKKSKLSFLNNMNTVTVMNTTYMGPKKNLVLVKVHNQVLLLGSDEKGIHFLTEIKDTASLFKDGEKDITGTNFDTNLNKAEVSPKNFKLKEEFKTNESSKTITKKSRDEVSVKLSDQIKNKMKNLKPLQ